MIDAEMLDAIEQRPSGNIPIPGTTVVANDSIILGKTIVDELVRLARIGLSYDDMDPPE